MTVNFGRTYAAVNVYDITAGVRPMKTLGNISSLSLTLNDHALIIEVFR